MLDTTPDTAAVARRLRRRGSAAALVAGMLLATACSPTVRLVPPDEPIRIDLTVTVRQDVRISVVEAPDGIPAASVGGRP